MSLARGRVLPRVKFLHSVEGPRTATPTPCLLLLFRRKLQKLFVSNYTSGHGLSSLLFLGIQVTWSHVGFHFYVASMARRVFRQPVNQQSKLSSMVESEEIIFAVSKSAKFYFYFLISILGTYAFYVFLVSRTRILIFILIDLLILCPWIILYPDVTGVLCLW